MAHRLLDSPGIMRARRFSRSRGFTLAELMGVVVIVAILAVIAIVSYRTLLRSARGTEAFNIVGHIRVQQEKYKQETDNINYLNLSAGGVVAQSGGQGASYAGANQGSAYPTSTPGNKKVGWGAACGSACVSGKDWSMLNVDTDGPVMFGYSTVAGTGGTPPAIAIDNGSVAYPSPLTGVAWYVVSAFGDPDNQGTYCTVAGTSFTNQIFAEASCK